MELVSCGCHERDSDDSLMTARNSETRLVLYYTSMISKKKLLPLPSVTS